MSAANNLPKPGSRPCGSPDDFYDDDIVNLLQYPAGDSIEKGYCCELFGQWPSSSGAVSKLPAAAGVSRVPSAAALDAGLCTYSEMGFLSRSECASLSNESGTCNANDRGGCSPNLTRAASANGALALGAERAAGLVSQTGRDEFSKVRTSMQPPAGSQLSSLPSLQAMSVSDQSFHSGAVATHGLVAGKVCPSLQCGIGSTSKLPISMSGHATSFSSGLASICSKGTMSNSTCFTAFRSRNSTEVPLKMPSAQESGCSHVTDEASVRRASDYSSSASSRGQPSAGQSAAAMPARFAPLALESHIERTAAHGAHDLAFTATPARSLSGNTLSTREASSNSGKRKLDDSESQSEDVEGESSVDIRRPRKPSSSKRNRAAEVHNLSERNRRNRINEKLKALQDLIPNSSKTDKASVLDEAIEYMKTLQMQLQMVSMRSGMSVSPMIIPLGMPHLQMAPLHPVGLGVPVGHPGLGMGMGLHMNMGMGMVDVHQGLPARPPQPISGSPNAFSIPSQFRGGSGLLECSLDSTNVGSIPTQLMPIAHDSSQVHPGLNGLANVQFRQQQDQWQHTGQQLQGKESFNGQAAKEE